MFASTTNHRQWDFSHILLAEIRWLRAVFSDVGTVTWRNFPLFSPTCVQRSRRVPECRAKTANEFPSFFYYFFFFNFYLLLVFLTFIVGVHGTTNALTYEHQHSRKLRRRTLYIRLEQHTAWYGECGRLLLSLLFVTPRQTQGTSVWTPSGRKNKIEV